MAHGHNRFNGTMFGDTLEDRVEKWNERGHALRAKNRFAAEVAGLGELVQRDRRESSVQELLPARLQVGGAFDAFGDPFPAFGLGKVHEFSAYRSAVDAGGLPRSLRRSGKPRSAHFSGSKKPSGSRFASR